MSNAQNSAFRQTNNWQGELGEIRALIGNLRSRVADERDTYSVATPEYEALRLSIDLLDAMRTTTFRVSSAMRIRAGLESKS